MKAKTITFDDKLWERLENCQAATKIFNASEFIRMAIEAAINRVEKKYNLNQEVEEPKEPTGSES